MGALYNGILKLPPAGVQRTQILDNPDALTALREDFPRLQICP